MKKLLLDIEPIDRDDLLSESANERLSARYRLVQRGDESREAFFAAHLGEAAYVIGRPTLTRETLIEAGALRAVFNFATIMPVQTSAEDCHRLGVRLLSPRPAVARPVGEHALGLTLALIRGIGTFGATYESLGEAGTLHGRSLGIVGWGSSARGVIDTFAPFTDRVRVSSIRASRRELQGVGASAASTDEVFASSEIVIVMTPLSTLDPTGRRAFVDAERLATMRPGAVLIVLGRRELIDLDAVVAACATGAIEAAIEVDPRLDLPSDHAAFSTPNLLVSSHAESVLIGNYRELGEAICEDIERMDAGLLPANCEEMDPSEFGENLPFDGT